MDALTVTLLILGLAVVSFSTRASFILYFRDMRLPAYVQRALRFVDEERAGGVHRPHADDAFDNTGALNEVHHPSRQVDELDAIGRADGQRFGADDQPAG